LGKEKMPSTTQATRLSLFFGKDRNDVLAGRYFQNPTGGGWLLEESLVAARLPQFTEDPRRLIAKTAAGDLDLPRKKEKIGKPFLRLHDEVAVTLLASGDMQLVPMRREPNGISAIQASEVPLMVSSAANSAEVIKAFMSALALVIPK
jgi:hypothetical protein